MTDLARRINRILAAEYPDARAELDYTTPFELLVATVLSAQTTDVRVNSVTPTLFSRFPTPAALASAPLSELEEILRPTGFYRAKARSVQGLSRRLLEDFGGEVPRTRAELESLPGVGRKTAHVVLGNAFDTPELTIDTHVGRLARRWGLTEHTDPLKVERDLLPLIDPEERTMFSHRTIFHGRRVCHARRPRCEECVLASLCPSA